MGQIVPDAVGEYIAALAGPADEVLRDVAQAGRAHGVPIVHDDTGRLLRVLVAASGGRRVLEIGTAIGYSALWMAPALAPDGLLLTIDRDAERAAAARASFERAGVSARVSVIVGEVTRYLHKVGGPFDLIFQDGDKQLYASLLDRLVGLLRPGGLLVTDNVLWSGEVIPGFVAQPARDPADTAAIAGYNAELARDRRLFTTLLPVGDGVAVSVRRADADPDGAR